MTLPNLSSLTKRHLRAKNYSLSELSSLSLFPQDIEKKFEELKKFPNLWQLFDLYRNRLAHYCHSICLQICTQGALVEADKLCIYSAIVRVRTTMQQLLLVVYGRQVIQAQTYQPISTLCSLGKDTKFSSATTAVLKQWFLAHLAHPYPSDSVKGYLADQAGISYEQVNNWFVNIRMRIWRPLVNQTKRFELDFEETSSRANTNGIFRKSKTQQVLSDADIVLLDMQIRASQYFDAPNTWC